MRLLLTISVVETIRPWESIRTEHDALKLLNLKFGTSKIRL